jgi:hypothetical protein
MPAPRTILIPDAEFTTLTARVPVELFVAVTELARRNDHTRSAEVRSTLCEHLVAADCTPAPRSRPACFEAVG